MGLKSNLIGLLVGSFSVGAISSRFIAGMMADKLGYSKIAILGLVISFGAICLYLFYKNWMIVVIARFLHGVGSSLYGAAALAIVTLDNDIPNLKEAVAFYTLGIMLGSGIVTSFAFTIYNRFGFNLIILLAVSCTLLALLCFAKKYTQFATLSLQENKPQATIRDIILDHHIYIPTINQFNVYFCYGVIMTFLPIISITHKFNKELWIFYTLYALSVVVSRFMISYIIKIFSTEVLTLILLAGLPLIMLLVLALDSLIILALTGVLLGLIVGLAMPIFVSSVSSETSPSIRGAAIGFFSSSIASGIACGSILVGFLTMYFSYTKIFILIFILTLCNALFYLTTLKNKLLI
jgi:MFS family permease